MAKTIDSIIYSDDMNEVLGVESKNMKTARIADGVHTIGINAFASCTQLEEIFLPSGLFRVKMRAFANCASLLKVHLADDMTYLKATWFKDLPKQYELICNEKSETFKIIKRSMKLKAHVRSLALSYAKSEKIKQVQSASIDALLSSLLSKVEGSFYEILSARKTAIVVLVQIGKNCGSFRFGTDSSKWLSKIQKIIEILGDQEKEGAEIYKELKESKLTLSELTSAGYVYTSADASGNFNLFMRGTLKGALKVTGSNTFSIFGARSIGYNASSCVREFSSVVLGAGLEKIEATAFQSCLKLSSITIPEGVRVIDFASFAACTSLTSISLPESVEVIAAYAFQFCSSLSSINIPKAIKRIGGNAFQDTNIANLGAPIHIQNDDGDIVEFTIKNSLAVENKTLVYATTNIRELVVPSGIEEIASFAFRNCKSLERARICEGVKKIGSGAFEGCTNLREVSLPDSIEQIEDFIFDDTAIVNLGKTYRVKSAKIRNKGRVVDFTIRDGFAMQDDKLAYVAFNKWNLLLCEETFVIKDFVKHIGSLGGSCKTITSLFIPASVVSIDFGALRECRILFTIKYGGTMAQWKAIEKEDGWNLDVNAKSVKCTDGDVEF